MPILYVLSGPDIGKTYEVGEGATLGRTAECDVVLRGNSVSRKHARIELDGDRWYLLDLASRNGIRLAGERVEEIALKDGLNFQVGDLELRFRHVAQGGQSAPSAPKPAARVEPEPEEQIEFADEDELELEEESAGSDDADGGIEFEDESLFDAPQPAPKRAEPKRVKPGPGAARPAPSKAGPAAPNRQAERMAKAGIRASKAGSGNVALGGRPALRFSNNAQSSGFLTSDLGQYPLWVRMLAGIAALALFAGLFYFAMRGTSSLKERAAGSGDGDAAEVVGE